MTDTDHPAVEAVVVEGQQLRRPSRRPLWQKILFEVPTFTYLLIFYVAVELIWKSQMRSVLFSLGDYAFTWVEILYMTAFTLAISELLRVSHPGVNNMRQALFMLAIGIAYLILFILGATGVWPFHIFSNFEFLMLLYASAIQVVMGFVLNGRTLVRTIDSTR